MDPVERHGRGGPRYKGDPHDEPHGPRHAARTRHRRGTPLCTSLQAPDPLVVPARYTRPDGTSQFTRVDEGRYTHHRVLDAEGRLVHAATVDADAPTTAAWLAKAVTSRPIHRTDGRAVTLAPDQATAVEHLAGSTRLLNVLVGPAGTGKTTTLAALKAAWEGGHGRGSVVGLAPSATAAAELGHALGIACENTAASPRSTCATASRSSH